MHKCKDVNSSGVIHQISLRLVAFHYGLITSLETTSRACIRKTFIFALFFCRNNTTVMTYDNRRQHQQCWWFIKIGSRRFTKTISRIRIHWTVCSQALCHDVPFECVVSKVTVDAPWLTSFVDLLRCTRWFSLGNIFAQFIRISTPIQITIAHFFPSKSILLCVILRCVIHECSPIAQWTNSKSHCDTHTRARRHGLPSKMEWMPLNGKRITWILTQTELRSVSVK